jgi:vitamin B12/bleomycin/antimicrobial peptide transport system ATP-binding/permease protein
MSKRNIECDSRPASAIEPNWPGSARSGAVVSSQTAPRLQRFKQEPRSRTTTGPHRLNLKFLRRTIRLAKPYWFSEEKREARWLLVLLTLLMVGYTASAVLLNQQSGEFTSALAARDGARFRHSILIFFGLLVIGVPIVAYYYYVRDKLALNWRRWLTDHLLGRYFKDRGYYRLLSNPEIDNPDQRMSDDIFAFSQQSLTFVLVFANGLFQLAAFGRVLWSISSSLVLILFLYAAVITAVTFRVFGEKMVSLHFAQRRREADFRFGLVRIRENAEAIALYRGERQEKHHLNQVFGRLFANATEIIRWSLRLNFFFYGNTFLAMVLPTLIIAPRVLSGELEVGRIVQATGAFSAILTALTLLVNNLADLSRFAASVGRLETFASTLLPEPTEVPLNGGGPLITPHKNGAAQHGTRERSKPAFAKIQIHEGEDIEFENVTLKTPNSVLTLIKELTVSIPSGEGLMIVGASGLGKSSLLRAIAGLWDTGEGTLIRPKSEDMLFLPQHAYMAIGSLRVQLNYPNLDRSVTDDELRMVLDLVNLGGLAERCGGFDADFDFEKLLSVGERQRLAFARVFLTNPRFVLLDEATSSLDGENESALYERLFATSTTPVSVSHHPALVKYHSHVLELKLEGDWSLHPAPKFRFTRNLT